MNESSSTAAGGNEFQVLHRVLFSGEVLLAVFHVSVYTARDAVFTSSTYEFVTVTTLPISSQLSQFFLVCWLCLCLTSSNFLLSLFLSLSLFVCFYSLLVAFVLGGIHPTDWSINQSPLVQPSRVHEFSSEHSVHSQFQLPKSPSRVMKQMLR